ncbi:unnamed protein product [Pieris brassicae]|uniref:Uncharacterized protein n=1 Tax=Pieris brassicae TaxID=7116 RepID=A0A9P0TZW1_PIEBR|nr:unnamed protein product [Pieris brassicae]
MLDVSRLCEGFRARGSKNAACVRVTVRQGVKNGGGCVVARGKRGLTRAAVAWRRRRGRTPASPEQPRPGNALTRSQTAHYHSL